MEKKDRVILTILYSLVAMVMALAFLYTRWEQGKMLNYGKPTRVDILYDGGQLGRTTIIRYDWPLRPWRQTSFVQVYDRSGKICYEEMNIRGTWIDGDRRVSHIERSMDREVTPSFWFGIFAYYRDSAWKDLSWLTVANEAKALLDEERARFNLPNPQTD